MEHYMHSIRQAVEMSAKLLLKVNERRDWGMRCFYLQAAELIKVDWLEENILNSKEYCNLLNELTGFKNRPVLYIIEIANDVDHNQLVAAIHNYRLQKDRRGFPAFWDKQINNEGHKILYVGKVIRDFHGRVMQHMGYHSAGRTQGLQLAHWAAALGVDVKVSYCIFEQDEAGLMALLEYQLADELKPLLGKHK